MDVTDDPDRGFLVFCECGKSAMPPTSTEALAWLTEHREKEHDDATQQPKSHDG